MAKDHGNAIKNDEKYEALREKGYGKSTAARIANTKNSGKKGGKAGHYEDQSKDQLYEQARKLEIEGRSKMSKEELIKALRKHRKE